MNSDIIKSKFFDIHNFEISKNNNNNNINNRFIVKYSNNENFCIQTPIIKNFGIEKYVDKRYLDLKLDLTKQTHLQFLTLIDSIETKIKMTNKFLKTQIITDIQNNKSLKIKIANTLLFDYLGNELTDIINTKIIILLNIECYSTHYSLIASQILFLNK